MERLIEWKCKHADKNLQVMTCPISGWANVCTDSISSPDPRVLDEVLNNRALLVRCEERQLKGILILNDNRRLTRIVERLRHI